MKRERESILFPVCIYSSGGFLGFQLGGPKRVQ